MSKHGAEIGDTVRVFWPNGERLDCTVKYMPQDVGDSWVVWSEDGTIHHIQQYETILVLNRKADIANPKVLRSPLGGDKEKPVVGGP